METNFRNKLKTKIDNFVHKVYFLTRSFPKEELYGVTSQIRRSSLSIALNYVEGYARKKKLVLINFLEISYGSLKETQYLLDFCFTEGYIKEGDLKELSFLADELGAMIWGVIEGIRNK